MVKDALIKTNPYLKKTTLRRKLLVLAAQSSTAIEGVHLRARSFILPKRNRRTH